MSDANLGQCELCEDSIDSKQIVGRCPNRATRQVEQITTERRWTLNVCESCFAKGVRQQEIRDRFDRLLLEDSSWASRLLEFRRRITKTDYMPSWFLGACFGGWPDDFQVYCLAQLFAHYLEGEIGCAVYNLGAKPTGDIEADLIMLEERTPDEVVFDDDTFGWESEIIVLSPGASHSCSPRTVALSIGSTPTSKVFEQVIFGGGVARWAADSEQLVVLVAHSKLKERIDDGGSLLAR